MPLCLPQVALHRLTYCHGAYTVPAIASALLLLQRPACASLLTPDCVQLHLLQEQLPEGWGLPAHCHKACLCCRLMRARSRSLKSDECMLRASLVVLLAHQLSAIKCVLSSVQLRGCVIWWWWSLSAQLSWWWCAEPSPISGAEVCSGCFNSRIQLLAEGCTPPQC